MTRAELLEKVLSGWLAIVEEFRGWDASSQGHAIYRKNFERNPMRLPNATIPVPNKVNVFAMRFNSTLSEYGA